MKEKFQQLKQNWLDETKFYSDSNEIVNNNNYQEIINLGYDVVPFILEDLKENTNHWFYALKEITNENPVKKENEGDIQAMKKDWIEWGENEGLIK